MNGVGAWRALLRKELRQLVPLAVGLGALTLWDACDRLLLKPPDMGFVPSVSWLMSATDPGTQALGLLLFGLFAAYNLLPGEHDQRTIELLYTLPIRRRTIFLTKYAAAVGVLTAWVALGAAVSWLQLALDPDSFARRQAAQAHFGLELVLDVGLVAMAVAYGVLASFFRGLGWVLVVLVWLVLILVERLRPSLAILDFQSLTRVAHDGTRPIVPWKAWGLHAAMSALALALAGRLWLGRQEAFAAFYERLRNRRRLWRVGTALLLAAAVLTTAGLVTPKRGTSGAGPAPGAPAGPDLAELETTHFRFTYHRLHAAQALFLSGEADEVYGRVRDQLRAAELETVIVDLTDESPEHLGVAGWKKVRIDVRPPKPRALLRFVFAHELTHVFAAALSAGIPAARNTEARFFHEGLANYVAYELVGDPAARAAERRVAAAARTQFQLGFEDLLDPEAFVARYDEHLLYSLGELWVTSLVASCGPDAPARLLRALASGDGAQRVLGRSLWRHALQQSGCDLERVVARTERQLADLGPAGRGLPLASGRLVADEGATLAFDVQVRAGSGPAAEAGPFRVTIRARESARTPPDQVQSASLLMAAGAPQRLKVPRPPTAGETFQFQIGAGAEEAGDALFSRWQTTTLEAR